MSPHADQAAGLFTLSGGQRTPAADGGFAEPADVALVLHTSGTTSRPKIVPLTQMNICTSAHHIRTTLKLTEADRCLNIMPLFHIHGLIGATLSSFMSGASVVCTPGFYAPMFFAWMAEFRPTWYTAVPTMHQALLDRAEQHREIIARCPLRLIRSSSASLPPSVMAALERTFNTPVVESYGMTEAAHQMASNPLPPGERKAGSVGLAAGPDVAIMDELGSLLPAGTTGEIVIRGLNVTPGYENNPAANKDGFRHGWFRTGDQGYLDAGGYLFISGRLKEIINRGGEKISPREVDEVLLEHPAVAQAVTFAVPHPRLGEDIAAAVVLRPDATVQPIEIQDFAAGRLADFKVPRQVLIVDEIPKGPTGKLQRIGLAEKLGVTAIEQQSLEPPSRYVAPRTPLEAKLAEIWMQVLGLEQVGVQDDFFRLGGDSILAARMLSDVRRASGRTLPLSILLKGATIEYLAQMAGQADSAVLWRSLVPIQAEGAKPPLFCVHGIDGGVFRFAPLARHLGTDQPFYALQACGLDGVQEPFTQIEPMATYYVDEIRTVQPAGPYFLAGYSSGGSVVYEMAQQLRAKGDEVALLAMLDHAPYSSGYQKVTWQPGFVASVLKNSVRRVPYWAARATQAGPERSVARIRFNAALATKLLAMLFRAARTGNAQGDVASVKWELTDLPEDGRIRETQHEASVRYRPRAYPGRIMLFRAEVQPILCSGDPLMGWGMLAAGGVDVRVVPGHHLSIIDEPHVRVLARELAAALAAAPRRAPLAATQPSRVAAT